MFMALILCISAVRVDAKNWEEGIMYFVGEFVTYNDVSYRCRAQHTAWTGANWNPEITPSLWERVDGNVVVLQESEKSHEEELMEEEKENEGDATLDEKSENEVETVNDENSAVLEWKEGEAYSLGQIVMYNNLLYKCIVDHVAWVGTAWNPEATPTLWVELNDEIPNADSQHNDVAVEDDDIIDVINESDTDSDKVLAESKGDWKDKVYAPYVDVMLWPTPSINEFMKATNNKYYTLAFILSNGGKPAWGGITPYNDGFYKEEISKIRQGGGDVIVSFGGANGIELALEITDVAKLQAAYQSVIDEYQLTWVDFDIEGFAVSDKGSVQRRNQAIAGLQKDNPNLTIAYCLPVMPEGLTDSGLFVLKDAKEKGVNIDVVNIMTMDYGPTYTNDMGKYAIEACKNTEIQIRKIGLNAKLGNTPMIGQNDVSVETFTLEDARELLDWAKTEDDVRLLSMWSITRDKSKGTGLYNCTMIQQDDYDFTNTFKEFNA